MWFLLLSFFFFFHLFSAIAYTSTHDVCGLSANLECTSEMCCKRLAENTGCKKSPKICHLGIIAQLRRAISSQLRHISTIGKKLVKQQYLLHMSHNMVNFSPLTAEISSRVLGTAANFNRIRVLPSILQ